MACTTQAQSRPCLAFYSAYAALIDRRNDGWIIFAPLIAYKTGLQLHSFIASLLPSSTHPEQTPRLMRILALTLFATAALALQLTEPDASTVWTGSGSQTYVASDFTLVYR
jgi:hypothetical protein